MERNLKLIVNQMNFYIGIREYLSNISDSQSHSRFHILSGVLQLKMNFSSFIIFNFKLLQELIENTADANEAPGTTCSVVE